MRVLVIGGTTFIGRWTVSELLARGAEVTLFHRGHHPNPFGDRVEELLGDRHDPPSVARALARRTFDGVIDIAYDRERGTGAEAVSTIASEVAGHRPRYVLVSSTAVYTGSGKGLTEEAPRRSGPSGSYGMNKVQAEDRLLDEHRAGRLTASIIRPSYVHGPYNPIPRETWFWDRILAGRPVILPDEGTTILHWSAVRDVAWGLAECLTNPAAVGEAFNIAEAEPTTHARFVELLAEIAGRPVELVRVPRTRLHELGASPGAVRPYFGVALDSGADESYSIAKAQRLLGFRPIDARRALNEAFEWYSARTSADRPDFSFDRLVLGR